jgi:hypothetical protein
MRIQSIPLLLLFLSANACEPERAPPDVDALVARWGEVRADFIERCIVPHTVHGAFGRNAEPTLASMTPFVATRAQLEATLRQHFEHPDYRLDRDAFTRCIAAHEALPACPVDPLAFFARAGCAQLFVGAREEGDGCSVDLCAPGLFCDAPAPDACGRCARDLREPDPQDALRPCDDEPMCGLYAAAEEVGAPCDLNCGAGPYPALACIEGRCVQRRVIDIGGACDSFDEGLFEPRSLRHCRDEDFGSTQCLRDEVGAARCVGVVRTDPGVVGGVFIPGAAVVSPAVGVAAVATEPSCAP